MLRDETTGQQVTTGTPIALLIENVDQRSKDYGEIKDKFRPGHADYTYDAKYGIRDYRGGGRSSARETAVRVAAGAIARKIVPRRDRPRRARADRPAHASTARSWDWDEVGSNPFFCPDARQRRNAGGLSRRACARRGSSVGAVIEVVAEGVPAGWGAPIYGKLDGDLAAAMMSINAVKGVEIGAGLRAAALTGERECRRDAHRQRRQAVFLSNHAGGILGGISTGQADRRALRGQADVVDPDAAQDDRPRRATTPRSSPRAATIRASASARCRSARR